MQDSTWVRHKWVWHAQVSVRAWEGERTCKTHLCRVCAYMYCLWVWHKWVWHAQHTWVIDLRLIYVLLIYSPTHINESYMYAHTLLKWVVHVRSPSHARTESVCVHVRLMYVCGMTHLCVWHDSFMCVAWLIDVFYKTQLYICLMCLIYMCRRLLICLRLLMCVAWLIDVFDQTQWYIYLICFICMCLRLRMGWLRLVGSLKL